MIDLHLLHTETGIIEGPAGIIVILGSGPTYNLVFSNGENGIELGGGSNRNKLFNNTIYENTNNGIFIGWAEYNVIYNNTICDNTNYGLSADDGTKGNIIYLNLSRENKEIPLTILNALNTNIINTETVFVNPFIILLILSNIYSL